MSRLLRRFSSYADSKSLAFVKPAQFYWVVKDVAAYPQFLKWIDTTRILTHHDDLKFDAEMTINFKVYSDRFTSTAVCQSDPVRNTYRVVSSCFNSHIFKSMVSSWSIRPDESGCRVDYNIDFEFTNSLYSATSSYFIGIVGKTTMSLFLKRARELYEKENMEKAGSTEQTRTSQDSEESSFEFLAKRKDIEREILIFQTLDMLNSDGLLSNKEQVAFKKLYFGTKSFVFDVHTLFSTFDSREAILKNKDKILFHLKSLIGYHLKEKM